MGCASLVGQFRGEGKHSERCHTLHLHIRHHSVREAKRPSTSGHTQHMVQVAVAETQEAQAVAVKEGSMEEVSVEEEQVEE